MKHLFQKAQMIAGPITITMERAAVVDFTSVYMEGDSSIIMKKPVGELSPLEKIFEPFHYMVWIYRYVLVLVFAISLALVNWLLPPQKTINASQNGSQELNKAGIKQEGRCSSRKMKEKRRTAWESCWFVFTNVMEQCKLRYSFCEIQIKSVNNL